jgi:hypothetical protein
MDDGYQEPTGLESVKHSGVKGKKTVRDGRLLILQGEDEYSPAGQRIR